MQFTKHVKHLPYSGYDSMNLRLRALSVTRSAIDSSLDSRTVHNTCSKVATDKSEASCLFGYHFSTPNEHRCTVGSRDQIIFFFTAGCGTPLEVPELNIDGKVAIVRQQQTLEQQVTTALIHHVFSLLLVWSHKY